MKLQTLPGTVAVVLAAGLGVVPAVHAQTKPALTRDVDRPSAQPVNGKCSLNNIPGIDLKCVVYTVPVGKRLVVESVGYSVSLPSSASIAAVLFGPNPTNGLPYLIDSSPNVYVVTPSIVRDFNQVRYYGGTQAFTFYLDELQSLAGYTYTSNSATYQAMFNFSGYLVDK